MADSSAAGPIELVAATANPDKVRELDDALAPGVVMLPRPDSVGEVIEDADTLEGNARLKAVAIVAATGKPALADDTGLEVDALDGRPGVWSARYSGEDATYETNVTKLLGELDGVPAEQRGAQFRTVVLVRWPDGRELVAEGRVRGTISTERRGGEGFGYDPVFVPVDGDGRSFAEMTVAEKREISHRGRAVKAIKALLAEDQ